MYGRNSEQWWKVIVSRPGLILKVVVSRSFLNRAKVCSHYRVLSPCRHKRALRHGRVRSLLEFIYITLQNSAIWTLVLIDILSILRLISIGLLTFESRFRTPCVSHRSG